MKEREPLRVMAIRGVGNDHGDEHWKVKWLEAMFHGINRWDPDLSVEFDFVDYEDLFETALDDGASLVSRLWLILGSDCLRWVDRRRRSRRANNLAGELRWTAGMVVQWMSSDNVRRRSRERLLKHLCAFQPDILFAHSLGSLISYDTLARDQSIATQHMTLVTFGSQLGNRCVQDRFPGKQVTELPVRNWFQFYNRHDDIFTARVRLKANNYREIDTHFDLPGVGDHAAVSYHSHAAVSEHVWRPLLEPDRLRRVIETLDAPIE